MDVLEATHVSLSHGDFLLNASLRIVFPNAIGEEPISDMENSNSMLFIDTRECLVREVLTGAENYFLWKKEIEIVLGQRNMLGFVNGKELKPADPNGISKWDRCDALVMCWIMNSAAEQIASIILYCKNACEAWKKLNGMYGNRNFRKYNIFKEMRDLVQGEMSLEEYHGRLVRLWNELDEIDRIKCVPGEECSCLEKWKKRRESDKVMHFLTGLNYSFFILQILLIDPLPSADVVFRMVLDHEMVSNIGKPIADEVSGVNSANQRYDGNTGERNRSSDRNGSRKNRSRNIHVCGYCGISGHLKDNCYKLVGYPPGHRYYTSASQ